MSQVDVVDVLASGAGDVASLVDGVVVVAGAEFVCVKGVVDVHVLRDTAPLNCVVDDIVGESDSVVDPCRLLGREVRCRRGGSREEARISEDEDACVRGELMNRPVVEDQTVMEIRKLVAGLVEVAEAL